MCFLVDFYMKWQFRFFQASRTSLLCSGLKICRYREGLTLKKQGKKLQYIIITHILFISMYRIQLLHKCVLTYLPTYLVSTITIQFIHVANGRLIQSLKKRIPPAEIIDKVLAYHSKQYCVLVLVHSIYCLKNSYQYKKLG